MAEISSKLFQKIRKIQYETTQIADDILAGAWHSAFKGQGMEFEEVREYQIGDDIRMIDWSVTARMNHPYLKVFGEERELTVFLIVDVSASSRFGSQNALKKDIIAEIGAVLAFSAIKNNDKVGMVLFSNEIEKYLPPKIGTRHVLRVIRELIAYEPRQKGTDLAKALAFLGTIQRKAAICFVVSDFICPEATREYSLLAQRHDLIAISVLDPVELEFPNTNLLYVTDLETDATRLVDTSNPERRKQYLDKAMQRLSNLETTMSKINAGFVDIRTDKPYLVPLSRFFKMRQKRR